MKINLNKPFPFINKTKDKILIAFLFGLFVYIFLIVFQPFGINDIVYNKLLFVSGFAIITSVIMMSYFFLLPFIYRKSKEEQWTLKNILIEASVLILIIAIFNWLYTSVIDIELHESPSFFKFIFITTSIGIIPTLFFILILEQYLSTKNESKANLLTKNLLTTAIPNQNINIEFGQKQHQLTLNLADLLCIKAEGNYVEIYYLENDLVNKKLIRSSLSKVKKQLAIHNQIKHCHRSFIVNTEHLEKVTGNARNFNLYLNYLDFAIPVSRSFPIDTIK
ncbi:MAG: LytTR family transcriptional regulator DNA-binding domain-containing protein [Saprospiraceae bacterium]